ncbi:tripartite tricarboxylate transporter TctB family protein [Ancylobacter polymorphus]|uniref:Tripartite tricarboxylate transporter TctB family protein n=1 Tax=Ancylobacter polymorphus TaxID=223390 RepID=A0A9E6ZXI2_9HYPH|nr:tripartite tricarboxylate transporter TctB family protein [Ancylobacter polymorphus]UOK73541.1 tripartite tricarboxylate transporter TctB family protein [Ancylobacter polymorphus]
MLQVRQLDIYVSIILVIFGGWIVFQGIGYGFAENGVPGGGFFPFWVGLGLVVCAAVNAYRAFHRDGATLADLGLTDIPYGEIGKVLGASALMAGFIVLAFAIGMTPAIFVLMLAIGAVFGPRNIRFYVVLTAIALVMTAILYFTFANLLGVPLI